MGRPAPFIPVGDRPCHHWHQMVRAAVLWSEGRDGQMTKPRIRCAIYTRKSSDEGLTRTSTRSTPNTRPVQPTSPASGMMAGFLT